MFAILRTGNKQYKVSVNDIIYTEKLEGKVGDKIVFDQILMVDNQIGTPLLSGATVVGEITKQGKQPKLVIIKHISQKHHTKKQGHRQPYTQVKIKEIKGA
jgi:large subunit ribosomal protein L21